MINFFEELKWRGMLHQHTAGVEEVLEKGQVTAYIGFDPTAPSLGLGNYVQVMLLTLFQRAGHKPIALMGGATGRIGDPSGKDKERELKTFDELDENLRHQEAQMRRFLNFEDGPNAAVLVNNYDFYKDMSALEFLRDVGKTLTVNYMMEKDSVQKRLATGISFTEFSYQLLQGYDYHCLHAQYGCTLQMGGSDQWGNMTSGMEFVRKNKGGTVHVITTPLLTKSDGTKFGKTEGGNIWLDGSMTSPYRFYQFWLNADDNDVAKFTRYFTFKSREEVEAMEATANIMEQKRLLAEELTVRLHGHDSYEAVMRVSQLLFGGRKKDDLLALAADDLKTVSEEIPRYDLSKSVLEGDGINILALLVDHSDMQPSRAEARRTIEGGGLSVNRDKVGGIAQQITAADLLHGSYLLVEVGKKNKFMVVFG